MWRTPWNRCARLLSLLPQNNLDTAPVFEGDLPAAVEKADIGSAARLAADADSLLFLYGEEEECKTALGRIGGMACGFVTLAGDPVACAQASRVARFVRMCDAFSLPVVTFVDAAGFQSLKGAAKVSHAYAEATTAKVTVIVGKAYGPVYIAAAGKSAGADVVLAWPEAVISPVAPATAVPCALEGPAGGNEESRRGSGTAGGGIRAEYVLPLGGCGSGCSHRCGNGGRYPGQVDCRAGNAGRQTGFPVTQEAFRYPVVNDTDSIV